MNEERVENNKSWIEYKKKLQKPSRLWESRGWTAESSGAKEEDIKYESTDKKYLRCEALLKWNTAPGRRRAHCGSRAHGDRTMLSLLIVAKQTDSSIADARLCIYGCKLVLLFYTYYCDVLFIHTYTYLCFYDFSFFICFYERKYTILWLQLRIILRCTVPCCVLAALSFFFAFVIDEWMHSTPPTVLFRSVFFSSNAWK